MINDMNSVCVGLSVFSYLVTASGHGTVGTAAAAGGLAFLLIVYDAPCDKDQDDKKDASAEDRSHVLIKERDHKITLSP